MKRPLHHPFTFHLTSRKALPFASRKSILFNLFLLPFVSIQAQTFTIEVTNNERIERTDIPVCIDLDDAVKDDDQLWSVLSATVTDETNAELPSQLDDTDQDGRPDELAFVTNLKGRQTKTFTITLSDRERTAAYTPRTFAQLTLRNPKVKEKNRHDIYLTDIFFSPETKDPFHVMHHHGVALESELIALRIYFDHRQTPDLYGKITPRLEMHDTQFYTTDEQKAAGYGDDILWVGNTFGFGAFRGWDGQKPTMLSNVRSRGQRIIATGPVRTIVELVDRGWQPEGTDIRTTATIRYTLWAGHRDLTCDVVFDRDIDHEAATRGLQFSTGLINVKDSKEMADDHGLRGLWGTDWPVAAKDSVGHKRETVGMGIYVPDRYRVKALPADKDNYGYVVAPRDGRITYHLAYTSDNETFGYHDAKAWEAFLKDWRKQLVTPPTIKIKK